MTEDWTVQVLTAGQAHAGDWEAIARALGGVLTAVEAAAQPDESASAQRGEQASAQRGEQASAQPDESASAQRGEQAAAQRGEQASAQPDESASAQRGEQAAAQRGEQASAQHGERASAGTGALRWQDGSGNHYRLESGLLELVLSRRERHDDGDLVVGAASVGDLRGQLPDGVWLAAVNWELGGRSSAGSVRVRFEADSVGPLRRQSPSWLASLLCAVSAAAEAVQGQITNRDLSRALGRRGASLAVGAVTLLPDGLPAEAEAPPGFTVVRAPTGYPNGAVLVADLEQAATEPDAVADVLLDVDRRYAPRQDESSLS